MHKFGDGGAAVRDMIHQALARHESGHLLHRLDCVLLVATGHSVQEVADCFGVDRRTIRRWVHAAYQSGMAALVEHHRGGRPAKLTWDQGQSIRLDLQALPLACGYADRQWTGKRLALHLNKYYAVTMSVRNCQRLIARNRAAMTGHA